MPPEDQPLPEITGYTGARWGLGGCMGYVALAILGLAFWKQRPMSSTQHVVAWVALGLIVAGLYLWNTLDDPDVAQSDRTSQRLVARLRRWLRRVLDIRPT
jgi:predicted metal-binding membrane protein